MKKVLTLLLILVMTLSMAACGGSTGEAGEIKDSLNLLETVWASYGEEELFPVGGGDSANMNWEGPGKFDVSVVDELTATFAVDADMAAQLDDAATLMHAMMANNFACGVYHVADEANVDGFADALYANLKAVRWMCGQPDVLAIYTVDGYVIGVYGLTDLVDTFEGHLQDAYASVEVVYSEAIA